MSWCGVRAGVWLAGGWGVQLGVGVLLGLCCGCLGVPLGLVGRVGRSRDGPWGCPPHGPTDPRSLGACAFVPCPLGVSVPSPGRCRRAFVLFRCL